MHVLGAAQALQQPVDAVPGSVECVRRVGELRYGRGGRFRRGVNFIGKTRKRSVGDASGAPEQKAHKEDAEARAGAQRPEEIDSSHVGRHAVQHGNAADDIRHGVRG